MSDCVVCGDGLPVREGPGRPARYCGEVCRRTREFEIRGVLRRIQKAEDEEQKARFELEGTTWCHDREGYEKAQEWWAAEVARLGERLRGLVE